MEFQGFRNETFQFFQDLRQNNSVEWFEANEQQFEEHVKAPFRDLLQELSPIVAGFNPAFAVDENLEVHFSEMRRGPNAPAGSSEIKPSLYAFFWNRTFRRLNDGHLFIGVTADGVTLGFSIYDFGAPQSKMRRVFKPRLRRYLHHLDEYIKNAYLRRGFDFHRYVRAAGRLGMREEEAFPDGATEWENTLGWVVRRHIHTESSRLTPGSFVTEVKDTFERLYPLYAFSSDPGEDWPRVLKVRVVPAIPKFPPPKPKVVAKPEPPKKPKKKAAKKTTAKKKAAEATTETAVAKAPVTAAVPDKKKVTPKKAVTKKKATTKKAITKKKATAKKAVAKKATAKKTTAKKKAVTKKKATAKKATTKKKVAARKKK